MTKKTFYRACGAIRDISNPEERERAARAIADVCAVQTAISTGRDFSARAGSSRQHKGNTRGNTMKFSFLTGDVNFTRYGGKWISTRQSNGEFDYFFVVELLNWAETVGEREAPPETYNVSLSVVSPHEAKDKIGAALDCCGITEEMLATATEKGYRDMALVEALHAYGVHTPVWSKDGNNWCALMKEARRGAAMRLLARILS